jgi:hypothetical protein
MKIIEFDPSRIFCENGFWGTSSVRSDVRFAIVNKWTPDLVRGDKYLSSWA